MSRKIRQFLVIVIVMVWTMLWARHYVLISENGPGIKSFSAFVWTYGPLLIVLLHLWLNQKEVSKQISNPRQERLAELERLMKTNIKAVISLDDTTYTIRSFDGGQNWYVCEETPEEGVTGLKPIETDNPVLLGQIPLFMALSSKAIALNLNSRSPSELAGMLMQHKRDYLTICGSSDQIKSFQLKTFDSGQNWYAVKSNENSLHILGCAEDVYPGLLRDIFSLERRDKLANSLKKNGCCYTDLKS